MEKLDKVLKTAWIARKSFWRETTDSTNTWAKEQAGQSQGKELNGALFLAEEQSAGVGRFGRVWTSPKGENIYMTLLLQKPEIAPESAPQITLIMGLSVAQAVKKVTGGDVGIKWPNDVVMSGRKICGILTEMQMEGLKPKFILTGVGINVNRREFPEELADKATSLYMETGRKIDRISLIAEIMKCFEENYGLFLKTEDLSLLKDAYEELLLNRNQQVRILEKQGESRGIALGINRNGELLVQSGDGSVRNIFSGEVSVRGLYSYV